MLADALALKNRRTRDGDVSMIAPSYNLWLVGIALLVTMAGCYASLTLSWRFQARHQRSLRLMLTCMALILGATTWAAHFISMLALSFPFPVTYDVQMTLISSLLSVLVVGLGLYAVTSGTVTLQRILLGAATLGTGFSVVHFIGMAAFQSNRCVVVYEGAWIVFSVFFSTGVAMLALWLAFKNTWRLHVLLGAALLTVSVLSMHFFAMLASDFVPSDVQLRLEAPALPAEVLAIVVSLVVFGVIGAALLVALPEGRSAEKTGSEKKTPAARSDGPRSAPLNIPVEKENRTLFLALEEVFYIQADSHYSRVCDGKETFFCNLSLAELEKRLPPERFSRVHRSFIVNLAHVKGLERDHDQGRLIFDRDSASPVPVSRRRMRDMFTLLNNA